MNLLKNMHLTHNLCIQYILMHTYKCMKPLLKTCNNINHVALLHDINVLMQQIEACTICTIHFLHENIKNQLPIYGKKLVTEF